MSNSADVMKVVLCILPGEPSHLRAFCQRRSTLRWTTSKYSCALPLAENAAGGAASRTARRLQGWRDRPRSSMAPTDMAGRAEALVTYAQPGDQVLSLVSVTRLTTIHGT
ncbi:MAG: hypothetical protein M5R42_15230, partial [Rhodocyclaceae bacterium]|nr:hypothetical protein [Rhodocyclaceae bacterium]